MTHHAHEAAADDRARRDPVRCAVLTISDTRTTETDGSGPIIESILAEAGHTTLGRTIVPDDEPAIRSAMETGLADAQVDAIISTGGTGLAHRDRTVEIVRSLLTHELDGFGELFRYLSFEEIGSAAMLSRALAGLVTRAPDAGGDTFLFALPGSTAAVRTAMTRLVAPELAHLVWLRRETDPGTGL